MATSSETSCIRKNRTCSVTPLVAIQEVSTEFFRKEFSLTFAQCSGHRHRHRHIATTTLQRRLHVPTRLITKPWVEFNRKIWIDLVVDAVGGCRLSKATWPMWSMGRLKILWPSLMSCKRLAPNRMKCRCLALTFACSHLISPRMFDYVFRLAIDLFGNCFNVSPIRFRSSDFDIELHARTIPSQRWCAYA